MTARTPHAGFRLLCGATVFEFTALGIFLATLPLFVTGELGGSRAEVGLAVGSFSVSAVLLRPFVGRGLDRRGRKVFLVGPPVILLTTAGLLSLANALWMVIGLRLLQGAAGAGFYTSAATMATDVAPPERRAEYIARLSIFLYGGFAIGPALAEWLIRRGGFGWAWGAAAVSASIAGCFALLLPETRPPGAADRPRGPTRLLHPAGIAPGVVLLTAAVGYTSITTFSPLFARHIGMRSSGSLYIAFAVTVLGVRLVSGRLADRVGRITVSVPGLIAGAAGMFILATVPPPGLAMVGVAVYGAGFAFLFPALMALAADRASDEERGEVLGTFTAFFDLGAATGGYLVGAIADRAGFGWAWATPGILCVVGLGVLARLRVTVRAEAEATRADETAWPEPAGT